MYYDRLWQRVRTARAAEKRRREALAVLDTLDVAQHEADIYRALHEDIKQGTHTTYYLPGGRGSCKSSFVSLELIGGIMENPEANGIVFRSVGATLRDSVFSQCLWAIDVLNVSHLWKARVSPMQMTFIPTGQVIIFRGLDDPLKLKSIRPPKGFFRYVWFEEVCELSGPNKLRSVLQSVMRGGEGFRVFMSFNPPISRANWCNVLVEEADDRAITFKTNYTQVPWQWLGEDFLVEAERLKALNEKLYLHEYMGIPVGAGGEVFQNVETREITDAEIHRMGYIFQGLDFGFAQDPACFLRVSYDRQRETIYLLDEIYKKGMSNRQIADAIKGKGYDIESTPRWTGRGYERDHMPIICDSAEPKSISDLRDMDLLAWSCHKEAGCVQYRVKWLQHRTIVVDPQRTPNAYRELVNYSYVVDKDGVFTSVLPDCDNHSIDALAYALDRVIYRRENPA